MNRARVSFVLLSVLLWHVAAPCFVPFLPTAVARGQVIAAAQEEGDSAWVPNATQTTELLNAIRGNQLRLRTAYRSVAPFDQTSSRESPRRIVRPHRSPYPTRHQLGLRLSRSESGELPH
jgi:hypothetical protein